MEHKLPRAPVDIQREVLDVIGRTCAAMQASAEGGDVQGLKVHFEFLKDCMNRLEIIRKYVRKGCWGHAGKRTE